MFPHLHLDFVCVWGEGGGGGGSALYPMVVASLRGWSLHSVNLMFV